MLSKALFSPPGANKGFRGGSTFQQVICNPEVLKLNAYTGNKGKILPETHCQHSLQMSPQKP